MTTFLTSIYMSKVFKFVDKNVKKYNNHRQIPMDKAVVVLGEASETDSDDEVQGKVLKIFIKAILNFILKTFFSLMILMDFQKLCKVF